MGDNIGRNFDSHSRNTQTNNNDGISPALNRSRGLSGLSGSSLNRRSSLGMAEATLGDLFGRRASGFSDMDVLGRRGSLDSTSAVLDAAIMDLTRRRLSMAMGAGMPGDDPYIGGGFGSSLGGMDALGGGGPFGMSSLGNMAVSSMGMTSFASAPPFARDDSKNTDSNRPSEMETQQQKIREQQRELELRQKELEAQRQQLVAAMEERRMVMQQMQQRLGQLAGVPGGAASAMQRNSLLGTFGGGIGGNFGGENSNLLMGGTFGGTASRAALGGVGGAGQPLGVPATGANPEWSVCRICNSRAFSSREEALQHETICMAVGRRASMGFGGGGGRRSSLDLLVGTLDHPEFAARLAGQSFRQDANSRRDSLGLGVMSDRRFSLLGMGGLGDLPTQATSNLSPSANGADLRKASMPNTMSSGPFAMMDEPMSLAMDSDKDWLTPLHCFVRKYCVHVFTATEQDVQTPSKGKRKPIQVGQVGIRCPHCHHDIESSIKARERGSVYYPTSISSIYNATMNLLQRHLHNCSSVPPDVMRRYETLKADDARSGTSKKYWIESALSLGLVDSDNGIRFSAHKPPSLPSISRQQISTANELFSSNLISGTASNLSEDDFMHNMKNAEGHAKAGGGKADSNAPAALDGATGVAAAYSAGIANGDNLKLTGPLVHPDDEPWATAFSYHLLLQMKPCVFTEADRLGKRKGLPPGFPGLACKHCFGGYGSGRFFPSSIKTLSDTSKTLNVLHNHMMRCRKCPPEIREILMRHRKTHDEQRSKMKFGSQKAFFARIWDRLHYKDPNVTSKRKFKFQDDSDAGLLDPFNGSLNVRDLIHKRQKI